MKLLFVLFFTALLLFACGCATSTLEKPIVIQQPDSLLTESGNIGIAYLERIWLGERGYELASQFNFRIQEQLRKLRLSGAKIYRIELNEGKRVLRAVIYYVKPFKEAER